MSMALRQRRTLADLLDGLGGIPPERIRLRPAPGTARERDVQRIQGKEGRSLELVDGVLVEKAMGFSESYLAMILGFFLQEFLQKHDFGIVAGADATIRLAPGLIRIPDVCFVSWDRMPGRRIPREPIPDLAPDLAVEVRSAGNTRKEILRKRLSISLRVSAWCG